jgi:hypothetical protein
VAVGEAAAASASDAIAAGDTAVEGGAGETAVGAISVVGGASGPLGGGVTRPPVGRLESPGWDMSPVPARVERCGGRRAADFGCSWTAGGWAAPS